MLESHCCAGSAGARAAWLARATRLHDQGGAQRQRVMQRKLHVSHHLHRILLGELHQRHVRPHVRRRCRGTRDSERRRLPVVQARSRATTSMAFSPCPKRVIVASGCDRGVTERDALAERRSSVSVPLLEEPHQLAEPGHVARADLSLGQHFGRALLDVERKNVARKLVPLASATQQRRRLDWNRIRQLVARWLPTVHIVHPCRTNGFALSPEARAQCGSSARWDLCGGAA